MVRKTEKPLPGQARFAAKGMCTACYSAARTGAVRQLRVSGGPRPADGSAILKAAVGGLPAVDGATLFVTVEQCERVRSLLVGAGMAELAPALGIEAFS